MTTFAALRLEKLDDHVAQHSTMAEHKDACFTHNLKELRVFEDDAVKLAASDICSDPLSFLVV